MTTAPLRTLPPFYCPIGPAISPKAAVLEQRAVSWIAEMGLSSGTPELDCFIGTHAAEAVCRMVPDADNEDRMLLFALWIYWAFSWDDGNERRSRDLGTTGMVEQVSRMLAVMEAPGSRLLGADPHATAMADIMRRLHDTATPTQVQRFIAAHRRWLLAEVWDIANHERGVLPSLDDFTVIRLGTAGGEIALTWLEIAAGPEIPGDELNSLPVRAAIEAATLVTGWDNDIYSHIKEQIQGTTGQGSFNIIKVLTHHNHCTLEQALTETIAIRDRTLTLFLKLSHHLKHHCSHELSDFLDNLAHAIRANIEWSANAPRYIGNANPISIQWAQHPSDTTPTAPNISSITWWWAQLGSRCGAHA